MYLPFDIREHSCGCWSLHLSWEENSRWLWLRNLHKRYNRTCSTTTERLLHRKTTSSVTFCRCCRKRYQTYHCLWTSLSSKLLSPVHKKAKSITEFESTNPVIFNYVRERLIEGNEIKRLIHWMFTTTVYRLMYNL